MRARELREAIVAALKAHAGLADLLSVDPVDGSTAIYDHVPQDATFPYAVVGDPEGTEHDADDIQGFDFEVEIHQFSRFRGFEEVENIQRQVDDALHRAEPLVTDGRITTMHRLQTRAILDADGLTRHGIHSFRVILEEL